MIYYTAYLVNLYANLHLPTPEWFVHWDSGWYLGIATNGYSTSTIASSVENTNFSRQLNYAFFPLYPTLIKILTSVSPFSAIINGQIISQLFFLFSLPLFYCILQRNFDKKLCMYGLILMAFSPFNIYFSSVYTESTYLFLSLAAWLAMMRQRWLLLGLTGLLLALTRPTGLLLFLPALWAAIEDFKLNAQVKIQYFFILLIPLGTLCYMIYLWQHMGDPLAFLHAEKVWRPGWNFHHLTAMRNLFYATLHLRKMDFFVLILSIYLMIKLFKSNFKKEALFFILPLCAALESGSCESIARYSACTFLFYFALVLIIQAKPTRHLVIFSTTFFLLPMYILGWLTSMPYFT